MIDKTTFKQKMILFLENFDYKISKAYIEIVYKGFNDNLLTIEDFNKSFQKMMYKQKSEQYGRPALGDWIEEAGKTNWVYNLQYYKNEARDKDKFLDILKKNEPELFNAITKSNKIELGVIDNETE